MGAERGDACQKIFRLTHCAGSPLHWPGCCTICDYGYQQEEECWLRDSDADAWVCVETGESSGGGRVNCEKHVVGWKMDQSTRRLR